MKWTRLTLTLILINCLLPALVLAADKTYGNLHRVMFIRNYDGDTVTFRVPNYPEILGGGEAGIGVRIYGIDTPEIRGKCQKEKDMAIQAKALVEVALKTAQNIHLVNIRRGKYFRIVAEVIADGMSVADELIAMEVAVSYFGKTKMKDWCE